jgi:hypothetical protein
MNMTSIFTRVTILVAFGAVVSVAIINRVGHPQPPSIAATAKVAPVQIMTPASKIVELPTILVRATTKELADAINEDADVDVSPARRVQTANHPQNLRTVTPTLPSLGMDMPYYSFGKALQRVGKE